MIDEEKTFREKGYYSTDLKPQSNKEVWAVCDDCGDGRWLKKCNYRDLCNNCAHKKLRKYDYSELEGIVMSIDEEKTYAEKGYRSSDLSIKSSREVYAVCVECGNGRWLPIYGYKDLCHACANKKLRKRDYSDIEGYVKSIDEEKTFRDEGYYSSDLSAGSSKKVYAICIDCGNGRWVSYINYTDLCHACAHKKIRKYEYNESDRVNMNIDEEKTYAEKGYRSTDLSMRGRKKVYAICIDCGTGRWLSMFSYRDLCYKCATKGDRNGSWKGGTSLGEYCKLFDEPLKDAVRNYFGNVCFECGRDISDNKDRKMSVHHVNYQKNCGCDNNQFCIYVPLCMKCHGKTGANRWEWYACFMVELALRNPNYYAYHIPVVYYNEPVYNYGYVFKRRK